MIRNTKLHIPSDISVEIRVSNMTAADKRIDTFIKQPRDIWDSRESWDMHKQIEQWNFNLNEVVSYIFKHIVPQKQDCYVDAIHGIIDMQLKQAWLRSSSYKIDKKITQKIQWLHEALFFDSKYTWLFMPSDKKINQFWTAFTLITLTSLIAFMTLDRTPQNNDTEISSHSAILVKKWDTLYKLAHQYGITIDQIKDLNNLKSDNIWIGQKLFIVDPNHSALHSEPALTGTSR